MEKAKVKAGWMQDHQLFKKFNRVLVQDSTAIALDEKLIKFFPGAANKTGQKATAKIQAVIDLVHEEFCHFELGAFTRNDQAAAEDIVSILEKNDLVLRDLGYFTLESIPKIEDKGAFYASRLRYGVAVFTEDGETRIDLAKILKKKGFLDTAVRIGAKKKILTRLIAVPVDDDTANERRRKARQNRDKRLNHSEDYFTLLGWNIFITNIPEDVCSAEQLCQIYGVRWRIETIFKAWKSHFKLTDVPKANVNRVKAQIYATLIWITFFQTAILTYYNQKSYEENGLFISMKKMAQFLREMGYLTLFGSENEADMELITEIIVKHCTYEKRNRLNYPQTIQQIG
jgi:hypothetical protein